MTWGRRASLMLCAVVAAAAAIAAMQNRTTPSQERPRTNPAIDLSRRIGPSQQLEVQQLSTREHFDRANMVVLARATGRRVDFGAGGNIFTFFAFETRQTIKGPAVPGFELRLLGGTIGDTAISLPIDREFQTDAEYLLMLGAPNAEGYPTLNPSAVFAVQTPVDFNRPVIVPGFAGLQLYDSRTGAPLPPSPDWVFLDDAIASLKRVSQ